MTEPQGQGPSLAHFQDGTCWEEGNHLPFMWMEAEPSVYLIPWQNLAPDHLLKEPPEF